MRTEQTTLTDLFKTSIQFKIPIYQRTYDWTRQNARQLYDDIVRVGSAQQERYHFLGAITCVTLPKPIRDNVTPYQLIDGQQRITSLLLLLRALRDVHGEDLPFNDAIINELLFNPHEGKSGKYYKIDMFEDDDRAFREIMEAGSTTSSGNMESNFRHFTEWLKGKDPVPVWYGIKSLSAVVIKLETKDDAQAIFESMNSTGRALSDTDMIQNYMLMAMDADNQKKIYESYWRPMEMQLADGNSREFDEFLRSYLMMKRKESVPKERVYVKFKEYMAEHPREEEIKEIYKHSAYYAEILGVSRQRGALERELENIRHQNTSIANPLLMNVLADYDNGNLGREDAKSVLRLIDSYLLRSYVCGTSKGGNKILPRLIAEIDPTKYVESFEEALMEKTKTSRFPRDATFKDNLGRFPLYMSKAICKYVLIRLEEGRGKGQLKPESLEIEHIMPQGHTEEWQKDLGERWDEVHDRYLHTIGNLTLTTPDGNQEMSNSGFLAKREIYKKSRLDMTKDLVKYEKWDEEEIKGRMTQLTEAASRLWQCPKGYDQPYPEEDQLEEEYLEWTEVSELWYALKKEIQSSCAEMRFHMTRVYGAFRLPVDGGTRDVGVCSIQALHSKLYLIYNTKIGDRIIEPSRFVHDVSKKGIIGVGDLRSTITSEDDIERAADLVKILYETKLEKHS